MPAKITLSPGRCKGARTMDHRRKPGKRGECKGWTAGAARRNADFLGSIIPHELTGNGVACSLTLKHCPPTAQAWTDCREKLLWRLGRMGLIRFHWVTEWQMRSRHGDGPVPHLHGILYFSEPSETMAAWVTHHWLSVTRDYGSEAWAQDAKGVPRLSGWLQYLTKHGSRSVKNAQRLRGEMPDEWQTAGRLWGKGGDWPTRSQAVIADDRVFYAYRRLVRGFERSQATTRLAAARRHRNAKQEAQALKGLSFSGRLLKYPQAPRTWQEAQPRSQAQLAAASALRPVSGFLSDFALDRWLQSLPPDLWRYADATEAPPVAKTPRIAADGGAGH